MQLRPLSRKEVRTSSEEKGQQSNVAKKGSYSTSTRRIYSKGKCGFMVDPITAVYFCPSSFTIFEKCYCNAKAT
uniref:Ovule protein n=1 Tax=Haemonchus contortus TaxID=6289 RepID=A0A7I4XVV3_HAECO|nr:unnamed protein product [Haemonchus contortus]